MRVRRSSMTTSRSEAITLGSSSEIAHAVGLEIEDEVEPVGRDVDVVRGDVLRREGVVLAAVALDEPRELAGAVRGRAPEHQVLEEVGDAGRAALPRCASRRGTTPARETIGLRWSSSSSTRRPLSSVAATTARRTWPGRPGGRAAARTAATVTRISASAERVTPGL